MSYKVRPFAWVIGTALILSLMLVNSLTAGQAPMSLGDLARKERAKLDKNAKNPARVFTNDDFALHPPSPPPAPGSEKSVDQNRLDSAALPAELHNEAYFRGKTKELRQKLADDKEFLARIQQEVIEHDEDFPSSDYLPPRWDVTRTDSYQIWASEDERLRNLIQSQEKRIARDEQAAVDLLEQCRRDLCEPEWVRQSPLP